MEIFFISTTVFFAALFFIFIAMWDTEKTLRKMTREMAEADFENYLKLLEKYLKLKNDKI